MGLFSKKKKSAASAKDRLSILISAERQGLEPETMEQIKNEIIQVIAKYVELDTEHLDITISPNGVGIGPTLQANIPILEKPRKK